MHRWQKQPETNQAFKTQHSKLAVAGQLGASKSYGEVGWANYITANCQNCDNLVTKGCRDEIFVPSENQTGLGVKPFASRKLPDAHDHGETVSILFRYRHWFVTSSDYINKLWQAIALVSCNFTGAGLAFGVRLTKNEEVNNLSASAGNGFPAGV